MEVSHAEAVRARPARDAVEERHLRKLSGSRHAPGDWIQRARMVVLSWAGLRVPAIAATLRCHQQTVRERSCASTPTGSRAWATGPVRAANHG
jgi:hypothetical protein